MINKIVNGEMVPLSEKEHLALKREWQSNDVARRRHMYKKLRQLEYLDKIGSVVDQLDYIYHNGLDNWKKEIKKVKDKYPKPLL